MKSQFARQYRLLLLAAVSTLGCSNADTPPANQQIAVQNESAAAHGATAAVNSEAAAASRLAEEAFVMHQTLSVYLLGKNDVQAELDLDDEQKKAINGIIRSGLREFYTLWGKSGEDAGKSSGGQPSHPAYAVAQRTEQQLRELLREPQRESLNRMVLRLNVGPVTFVRTGPLVFLLPEVDRALKLTPSQRQSIVETVEETNETVSNLTGSSFRVARVGELLADGRHEAEGLLTESQQKTWHELLGDSVKE